MGSSLTNFPNGIKSFGVPVFPGDGYSKVVFVGSVSGINSSLGDSYETPASTLLSVLKDGVADTSDRGTLYYIRKGHTENISAADHFSLLASRKRIAIVGEGSERERPTFTFSAAAATWLIDTDSTILSNLNINLEPGTGTVTVAAPITVSGNGSGFINCKIRGGTDANNKVTTGITFTGDDCFMNECFYYGAIAAAATNHIVLTGADRFQMNRSYVSAATTANGVGVIQSLTTANTDMWIRSCDFSHTKAGSTAAVTGIAGDTGVVRECHFHITANGTIATDQAGAWTTKGNVVFRDCTVTDNVGEVGVSLLPVSA